jgi:hypothetical protein
MWRWNLAGRLDRIECTLARLLAKETTMAASLDEILTDVTQQKTVIDGVLVLIQQLAAAKDDPVKLQAIADQLVGNTGALQAALDANTTPPTP